VTLPLIAALVFTVPTVLLALLVGLVLWLLRKPQQRFWRVVLWLHLGLLPLHLFVTFPLALGLHVSRGLGTRSFEQAYTGPRTNAAGTLLVQNRDTLEKEREAGQPSVGEQVIAQAKARAHFVASSDGVSVRVFRLESKQQPPLAVVVMVHGLFRSSMELEPVAAMLHERGCECWLVDQRNHGGSSRAPFTGGLREKDDIVAVVDYVRRQPDRRDTQIVLFGVSLGTIAVSLALPHIDGIAGVVLDAPIEDLTAAAHRMMTFDREGDRRSLLKIFEPWRSLTLTALGAWSGFDVRDVSPTEVLATLPHDLPFLLIGEGLDDRAPPATVRALFDRLPMAEPLKELWHVPDVGHGRAFLEQPAAYDQALGRLLQRLRKR